MDRNLKDRRRAQELRKNQTKEENHLWYDFLKTYPMQFRRQYQIGLYYADFYCYQAKVVVELDGAQHYESENQQYDDLRTEYMKKQGIVVLRIPNSEIWKNFVGVCEAIDTVVRDRLAKG